jgi:flagellar basal-body rod protein FlgG
MNRSMISASVTMGQLQKQLDTISNNLSNVDTNGFKRRDVRFSDLLTQQMNNQPNERLEEGRRTPNGIRQGNGARAVETPLRLEQGSIEETERELDLALKNPYQFFQIEAFDNDGNPVRRYSRDGAFYLSPAGNGELSLVTKNGDHVLGANGPISIPEDATNVAINDSGEITVTYADDTTQYVDQLEIANIIRPQLLLNQGDNLYALPDLQQLNIAEGDVVQIAEQPGVQQFALETSNVDVSAAMTDMLTAQRSYQFNAKSISIADQMMGLVNGLR